MNAAMKSLMIQSQAAALLRERKAGIVKLLEHVAELEEELSNLCGEHASLDRDFENILAEWKHVDEKQDRLWQQFYAMKNYMDKVALVAETDTQPKVESLEKRFTALEAIVRRFSLESHKA